MLACGLKLQLLVELIVYAWVGVGYVGRGGAIGTAIIGAVAVFCGIRLGLVIFSFAVTRSVPPGRGSGIATVLRLIVAEWITIMRAYSFTMVFPLLCAPRDRPSAGKPILLVHGYLCNAAIWQWFARELVDRGFAVYVVTLEPVLGDIEVMVDGLAAKIESIAAQRGERVTLVAHSMGGLVSRAYVRRFGAEHIEKFITCGTPHQGTILARVGIGRDARQMKIGNPWLAQLLRDAPSLQAIPGGVVTIYSDDDNLVAPQDSATVPGAKVVQLAGVSHTAMPYSARIRDAVLANLQNTTLPE
jgi:pimeloyl-ACP methyl ester carboxylesterase